METNTVVWIELTSPWEENMKKNRDRRAKKALAGTMAVVMRKVKHTICEEEQAALATPLLQKNRNNISTISKALKSVKKNLHGLDELSRKIQKLNGAVKKITRLNTATVKAKWIEEAAIKMSGQIASKVKGFVKSQKKMSNKSREGLDFAKLFASQFAPQSQDEQDFASDDDEFGASELEGF